MVVPVVTQIPDSLHRIHLQIQGTVQGVGFRPFIYTLATEIGLQGWVKNTIQGVEIEVEGSAANLELFLQSLQDKKPPHATIEQTSIQWLSPLYFSNFEIQASEVSQLT